jgi:hypothetical protein
MMPTVNKRRDRDKRQVKPKFLTDPITGQQVYTVNATLCDIKAAQKKRRPPSQASRTLVTIPSPQQREIVYEKAAAALSDLEMRVLPTYGGRPWKCVLSIHDNTVKTKSSNAKNKSSSQSPYFVWQKKGTLELAVMPQLVAKIPEPPRFPGFSSGNSRPKPTPSSNKVASEEAAAAAAAAELVEEQEDEEEELTEEQAALIDLQEREMSGLSELAWNERWRVPVPTITYKWISPLRETFSSRKSAWDRAMELCKNEVLLDKVLVGYGANGKPLSKIVTPTRKMIFDAGKLRFERDGLWVVGQEESWQEQRLLEQQQSYDNAITHKTNQIRKLTGQMYFMEKNRQGHRQKRLQEILDTNGTAAIVTPPQSLLAASSTKAPTSDLEEYSHTPKEETTVELLATPTTKKIASFTLKDADNELRLIWKNMADEEKQKWIDAANREQFPSGENQSDEANENRTNPLDMSCILDVEETLQTNTSKTVSCASIVSVSPTNVSSQEPSSAMTTICKTPSNIFQTASKPNKKQKKEKVPEHKQLYSAEPKRQSRGEEFTKHKRWCLTEEQIQLCYDAGMDHYDRIMRTVTARDLTRELQDGFDLLRERCRGRFDMELPVFDESQFAFLNDIQKAPWMPIVRGILGKDVVLIHKGMFLSMPGSEKQPYHQDGPHLTTQYQRACHAINVFVPLVDLTVENGPTEFCLGSHILGHEVFDEDFVEVPTPAAGTPLIFDYRLGHRGLGNSSTACRPIVYCTYAAAKDGKEFRDSVNFSRKRYHRIGDLVEKGLSREERALKRKRAAEEMEIEKAKLSILEMEIDKKNKKQKGVEATQKVESIRSSPCE